MGAARAPAAPLPARHGRCGGDGGTIDDGGESGMSFERRRRVSMPLLVLLLLSALAAHAQVPDEWLPLSSFPQQQLTIVLEDGSEHSFDVYVASTSRQRTQGLMNVTELAANAGMLFLFYPPQPVAMWMRNTLIGLDMLFIRDDGTIANIIEAEPQTLKRRRSEGRVTGVLELNAGTAERLGIGPGDRVIHSHFRD